MQKDKYILEEIILNYEKSLPKEILSSIEKVLKKIFISNYQDFCINTKKYKEKIDLIVILYKEEKLVNLPINIFEKYIDSDFETFKKFIIEKVENNKDDIKTIKIFLQKIKANKRLNQYIPIIIKIKQNNNIKITNNNVNNDFSDFILKFNDYLNIIESFPENREIKINLLEIYNIKKLENEINLLKKEIENRISSADISNIEEYFYEARKINRDVVCFLGPTNSGKTHSAVKELKNSTNGIFLSPLRLLANEIYDELKEEGFKVNLYTGDKIIEEENNTHICSTIEMVNLHKEYDVAIIDEIQFLNHFERGNSWTRALLGLRAKKIFLIGSLNSEPLIKKIMNKIPNDNLTINYKTRLAPLHLKDEEITLENLEEGDCLVVFSKNKIYQYKFLLESLNKNVNIIYGDLPYETKVSQSKKFNNKEGILISTDAIGYGLNLNIKRIVFEKVYKYFMKTKTPLTLMEFQQISGRAGRYKLQENGEVLLLQEPEEAKFRKNTIDELNRELYSDFVDNYNTQQQLEYNYFFPETTHLLDFYMNMDVKGQESLIMSNGSISLKLLVKYYFVYFKDTNKIFKLIEAEDFFENIGIIENQHNNEYLTLEEKYTLSFAPVIHNKTSNVLTISEFTYIDLIKHIINNDILTFEDFYSSLKKTIDLESYSFDRYIEELIEYYKNIKLFMWCANKYNNLKDKELAERNLELITISIEEELIKKYQK